jgi:hypothetical protein
MLVAAYGLPTRLYFGTEVISSETGSQQGDPLAQLAFCGVLSDARDAVDPTITARLELEAWFADDGHLAGDIDDVIAFYGAMSASALRHGLVFDAGKLRVACHESLHDEATDRFGTRRVQRFATLEAVGSPLGDAEHVAQFSEALVTAAENTFRRIAQMPHVHQSAATLAFCGKGLTTHLCRTALPPPELLRRLDDSFADAAASIYGVPSSPQNVAAMRLAVKDGGFGYRPAAPYARLAFVASAVETASLQGLLVPALRATPLTDDGHVTQALRDLPFDALSPLAVSIRQDVERAGVAAQDDVPADEVSRQRGWSVALDRALLPQRLVAAGGDSVAGAARLKSCAGSHHALHPIVGNGQDGFSASPWLTDAQMAIVAAKRLGEPLYEEELPCQMCRGASVSDVHGEHSCACMGGGHRTRLHHGARDDFARLAAAALAQPRVESACFPGAPGRRCDILLNGLRQGVRPSALDYACIGIATSAATTRQAAEGVGGAATAYEEVKRRSYGSLPDESGVCLVPVIQEMLGAYGTAAVRLIKQLARRVADRTGTPRPVVLQRVRTTLMAAHYRRLATLLLLNQH